MELVIDRERYYSKQYVLYELLKQLKYRYLSVRKQDKKNPKKYILSRYYLGYNLDLLKQSLERNDVLNDKTAKLYFDLATWGNEKNSMPLFSFDKNKRKEQKEEFSKGEKWKNYIQDYSLAIDIDNKNLNLAYKDAKKIKEVFDMYKLPYSIKTSAGKGMHFLIDSKWIKTRVKPDNRAELFGKVVQNLAKDENCKNIDFSIYDCRRILKLAYSLSFKNNAEYVALPLDDNQFSNFNEEDHRLDKVMRNVHLFKRGLLERDHNLPEKKLLLNTSKFIKEYK